MQTESKENTTIDDKPGKLIELSRNQNNNHHVVPLGILIVLCTTYLMIAGLQINYNYYFKSGVDAVEVTKQNDEEQIENQYQQADGRDVGISPQPTCKWIDMFTKDILSPKLSNNPPVQSIIKRQKQLKSTKKMEYGANGLVAGTGNKQLRTLKNLERKKDISKKTNTAEPIIYLFALVFIYLLLKAASDINQHYKSQNKGDKRLRRCSLQSYAQKEQRNAHQDRRASKGVPLRSKHHLFTEGRSISLDRYRHTVSRDCMRKQISIGDNPRTFPTFTPVPTKPIHPATAKLLSGDCDKPRTGRRLSVPITINYQTINVTPIVHPELQRRGSVISIGSIPDITAPLTPTLPQATDIKRRVRMINRH